MADTTEALLFSGVDHFLANSSDHSILLRGKTWPTVSHYYQGCKFHSSTLRDAVRQSADPSEAAKALEQKHKVRENWSNIKEQIMYEALLAKFTQHVDLRAKLIETGEQKLVADCPDPYWGQSQDPFVKSRNRLGVLLMEVRAFLKRLSPDEVPSIKVFEDSDPTSKKVFITEEAQLSVRRQKCKARRNVWKDEAGVSLFELENDRSGNATLVGQNIQVPLGALPTKAKFVAKQYQFEKRFEADSDEFSESDDYDEYDNHESAPAPTTKIHMGDFIPGHKPRTAQACIEEVAQKLEVLSALPEGDSTATALLKQCKGLQQELIDYIQKGTEPEATVALLFGHLDLLNATLAGRES